MFLFLIIGLSRPECGNGGVRRARGLGMARTTSTFGFGAWVPKDRIEMASKDGSWSCGCCTSHNPAGSAHCEVCNQHRSYGRLRAAKLAAKTKEFRAQFGPELTSFFIPYPDMKGSNSGETAAAKVLPGLWISGSERARDVKWLGAKKIGAICNCAGKHVKLPSSEELTAAGVSRVKLLPLNDVSGCKKDFERLLPEAIGFISENFDSKRGVLVHCSAGVSRSCSVLTAYLVSKHDMSLRNAFALVRSKRQYVYPNLGFWEALIALEKRQAFGKASAKSQQIKPSVPPEALIMHSENEGRWA